MRCLAFVNPHAQRPAEIFYSDSNCPVDPQRKINYTGDWLMGLAWCLVTGFDTFVTYFYAIYFAVLLVHVSCPRVDGVG